MKVLVVVRQVPDSTATIKIRSDGQDIERGGIKMVVNPFDEFAIEQAVQLREQRKDVEKAVALIVGPQQAAEALRTALAVGCDEGIHVHDEKFAGLDELRTAALVAEVVKDDGFDLLLMGKQEIDLDSGQTGPALAELLGVPHVGAATKLQIADDGASLVAHRRIEGAEEVMHVRLPALVTADKGLCEMRYPSLPNLMKAKKKPVRTVTAADVPALEAVVGALGGTEIHAYEPPPERPPGRLIAGEPEEAARELARLLREEAKVI